ncbi:MAG: hypothetical protein HYZ58_10085 [Acidobacteria bacterium]|nr:hypothetical protein [Acidobacteriota bacterium]MBI3263485.1 hypothetical protein [Acidobacteriota bacterium]
MRLLASLTNRVFLASALLAVLSIGVAIYLVNDPVTREGEVELQRGMLEAGQLLDEHRRTLSESFKVMAELLADLPKLKAAVDTHDPPTVEPLAADYRNRVHADMLVVTDRAGRVLSSIGSSSVARDEIPSLPAIRYALAGARSEVFWPHPDGILQVVTVPLTLLEPPQVLGTLSLGFLLDDDLARQFKSITDSEIAFAIDGEIKASTLPSAYKPQLASLLQHDEVPRIVLGDHDYVALVRTLPPFGPARAEAPAGTPASGFPVAIILRSRTERLQFVRSIHTMLAVTALVAVLMATVLSYAVSRTVTRPLAAITSAMKELARTGDLTRKIELRPGGWMDEDARLLATTFNGLTDSIARFQREVAERERLSSLGRLSTVVAHEIRNPLMIMKASLRTLRRPDASPDDIREAVGDIDEETRRLNRIVNEVLDYARPIVYQWSATHLNDICRGSVAEAIGSADEGRAPKVRVDLAPDLPPIVTDPERLRTALTNLLTNARQAVEARPRRSGGTDPDIDLSTTIAGPGQVAIVIRDHGIGIEAAQLSHVFDPYFTTKRTGTGIGLAITRNIIEGMGGSITLASEPGTGTEVRVELPLDPADRPEPAVAAVADATGPGGS